MCCNTDTEQHHKIYRYPPTGISKISDPLHKKAQQFLWIDIMICNKDKRLKMQILKMLQVLLCMYCNRLLVMQKIQILKNFSRIIWLFLFNFGTCTKTCLNVPIPKISLYNSNLLCLLSILYIIYYYCNQQVSKFYSVEIFCHSTNEKKFLYVLIIYNISNIFQSISKKHFKHILIDFENSSEKTILVQYQKHNICSKHYSNQQKNYAYLYFYLYNIYVSDKQHIQKKILKILHLQKNNISN
eukprot:TRINITY_DN17372_c0_g1_i2.p1 TRINITY_DN17372_c0_g1~~TRINITY_DN17372_c0_g1_i2.p1  ORF type:complete len:242 (+),score=-27.94 TRINITY_DN17372_c0_g1_i2:74-799(+)